MPTAPKKYCSKCLNVALPGSNRCAAHQGAAAAADKARHDADPLRPLYKQAVWYKHTRNEVLYRCENRCQMLTDGTRCQLPAAHIHHVIPAADWMAQGHDFCDLDNLVGLCEVHHNRVTAARRNGSTEAFEFSPPDNGFSPCI